jgi:hypothetical protein
VVVYYTTPRDSTRIHVPEASERFDANSVKSLYKLLGPIMDSAVFL